MEPFLITQKLTAWALFLQSIEALALRKFISNSGIWRGQDLDPPFFLKPLVGQPQLQSIVLILRLILAIIFFFYHSPYLAFTLLILQFLYIIQWRGSSNGGSDAMSLQILIGLSIPIQKYSLMYIALQACASYFFAGLVKLRSTNWRNGEALRNFTLTSIYQNPALTFIRQNRGIAFLLSWITILFEILFPLAFFRTEFALVLIAIAGTFHFLNIYLFGLNRFFWIWIATYPAIYFYSFNSFFK